MIARGLVLAALAVGLGSAGAAPGEVVRVEHRDPSAVPTRGPGDALVTIEVFFEPKVGRHRQVPPHTAVERLQAKHPARVRIVYRVMKRGDNKLLAIAAMEAHAQGKFDEFLEEIAKPVQKDKLSREEIIELGKKVDMDEHRLGAAIASGRYADVFEINHRRWDRFNGTTSLPNALFNDRPIRPQVTSVNDEQLEKDYVVAYNRSLELIDNGVAIDRLQQAFDDKALRADQPFVASSSADDDYETEVTDHPLASPPLALAGLPSYGKPNSAAPVPIVVLCRPNDTHCGLLLANLRTVQETYANEIRIIFAPWFRVTREDADDAAELAMLGDAALCAEQLGSNPEDLNESPGWVWTTKVMTAVGRGYNRRVSAEKLIDSTAAQLRIDSARMSACRARMAGTTLDWITAARRSGVTHAPATIVGGRIYHGLADEKTIKHLAEAELAPGMLARCATVGCSSDDSE